MRIGILVIGIILIIATYTIAYLTVQQKQVVHQTIGAFCGLFFGPIGPARSASALTKCDGYLSMTLLYYLIGGILVVVGVFAPGRRIESEVESRAGGKVWNEIGHVDKPLDKDVLKVLKMRYAKGEITKDEYDQAIEDLKEDSPHHSYDSKPY